MIGVSAGPILPAFGQVPTAVDMPVGVLSRKHNYKKKKKKKKFISETEEFTDVIREAAFVGVIRIKQESVGGRCLMSVSVSVENKLLMENVPLHYQKFEKVFGIEMQSELPEHGPQDIAINLLPDAQLSAAKLYSMSQDEPQLLREYIDEMLANGKIPPGSGALGCAVFFVKEKTGKMRLVVDYRGLNAFTIKDSYPIPLMTTLMEQIQDSTWFTKLDLKNGFNLIRAKEGDEWITAFKTKYGMYEYKVMPFGLANAPSEFQPYVNNVLKEHIDKGVVFFFFFFL